MANVVNKDELLTALAIKTGYTKRSSKEFYDAFLEVMVDFLKEGRDVSLADLGYFSIRERKGRLYNNPTGGEKPYKPPVKYVHFKPAGVINSAARDDNALILRATERYKGREAVKKEREEMKAQEESEEE